MYVGSSLCVAMCTELCLWLCRCVDVVLSACDVEVPLKFSDRVTDCGLFTVINMGVARGSNI